MAGKKSFNLLIILLCLIVWNSFTVHAQSEYIGTWENSNVTTKITLVLDQDHYMFMMSQKTNDQFIDSEGFRGSLIVEGNLFLLKLEETYQTLDGSIYNWYSYFKQPDLYGEINIENDTLMWMIDFTEDGDYDDIYEQITLIKQI